MTTFRTQTQVSLMSLCAYFVRQTEPKILLLVSVTSNYYMNMNEVRGWGRSSIWICSKMCWNDLGTLCC